MSESTSRTSHRIAKNPTGLLLDRYDYEALFGPTKHISWKYSAHRWVGGKRIREQLAELTMRVLRK